MTPNPNPKPSKADRLQDLVLVLIVLLVGLMAGAASFTHVHDWTLHNSPNGTHDLFGWANAVITELVPTASLIVIARRRRRDPHAPIGYPMTLLVLALGVSLMAQLAVARLTPFGWIVSALPALAFFALSKLVFSATRSTNPVPALTPATVAPATAPSAPAPAMVRPVAETTTTTQPVATITAPTPAPTLAKEPTTVAQPGPEPVEAPVEPAEQPVTASVQPNAVSPELLSAARLVANAHLQAHGEPITRGQLATRLRVPTPVVDGVLSHLTATNGTTHVHNGRSIGATR